MKKMFVYGVKTLCTICLLMAARVVDGQDLPWRDRSKPMSERVEWIVSQLSTDEKLQLMLHQNPPIDRIGLPAYSWWNEALHGVGRAGKAKVYPMPIAMAATFEPAMVRRVFSHVAFEARRKHLEAADTGYRGDYSGLTFFTPNINLFRDPRWGRGMETYGEDPCLTAMMGLACVEGLQRGGASACLKHLAVHSGPEGSRHSFDSEVGECDLRATYLPAFEYIVRRSNVAQVMCGYNRLNGEPCCTHRRLLTEILRGEWGYDGIVVTDCWALNDAYELDTVVLRHRTHASAALAYGDAFGGEVDLECGSGLEGLRQAVAYGYVDPSRVDEHVRRLLRVRLAMMDSVEAAEINKARGGLHDDEDEVSPVDVAARSMVLLKNNGVLPLRSTDRLQLEGPNMWDTTMPLGNYNGTPRHTVSIGEGLQCYSSNTGLLQGERIVVYAGGLSPRLEGEELPVEEEGFYRGDRTRIELPRPQVEEIRRLHRDGAKVVLVLCAGSAVAIDEVEDDVDAVLVGWYGGEAMGTAVAQLLYGERDDFGRLPITFYQSTSQLPPFEDYAMTGRTYRYMQQKPAYPFGYGLNYNNVSILGASAMSEDMSVVGMLSMDVKAEVASTKAVVQVYLKPRSLMGAPFKQLVGTVAIDVPSIHPRMGFSVQIDPFWLRQYNPASGRMEEPEEGTELTLLVGTSSADSDLIEVPFIYHRQ